jgi:hypothetical protein
LYSEIDLEISAAVLRNTAARKMERQLSSAKIRSNKLGI